MTTKILRYDLGPELQEILSQLDLVRGEYESLTERFSNIDIEMLAPYEKSVVSDLINSLKDTEKSMSERVIILESLIETAFSIGLEEGNYTETFEYDLDGNVTSHSSTGDKEFKINYKYNESGDIESSELTANNGSLKVDKNYVYENGNIVGITTKNEKEEEQEEIEEE